MTKKTILWVMLVMVLAFGMTVIGCDNDPTDNDRKKTDWWTWVASQEEGELASTATVNITPTSDDTGCDVSVTGAANERYNYWATQVGYYYGAKVTVGKTYKVTWKWEAKDDPFENVTIRYTQQKDFQNDSEYEFGTDENPLTIPTTEETKTFVFTMPTDHDCYMYFVFMVGEDTGSFKIRDFKIEEADTDWWTWVATQEDGDHVSTATVNITPTSDDTGCDISVTGTANETYENWATQVGYYYGAKVTAGKTYKVTWKWEAKDNPFQNVTIRYTQQKDFENDSPYEFGTDENPLTIPTTEETKTFEFTMPTDRDYYMYLVFMVGGDIGSFKIRDFKIEEADGV